MSQNIDDRIVKLSFDNADFERKTRTSLNTLDKLREKLDFKGFSSGLKNFETTAQAVDLNPLVRAAELVEKRFSALGTIGARVMQNIADSVVSTGKKLISSLSIDQVTRGWSKYEEVTNAVKTIMAATNRPIEDVEKSMEKLNWFTDETSYSLTDMTSNIGKFTSQGVELETAVTAMQGISTWAALSGRGTAEASRAMYNLSQAIGIGAVKLQDWKSIENANMATKEFKEQVLETAAAAGKLVKRVQNGETVYYTKNSWKKVDVGTFSNTLSDGWFTKEVLLETLGDYGSFADDVYNISKTMESGANKTVSEIIRDLEKLREDGFTDEGILGLNYTEEQLELVKKAVDGVGSLGYRAFVASQEAKTLTEAINSVKDAVSTGWMNTFNLIFGNYEEAKVLWTDLANELYEIFAEGGNARNDLLREWKEGGGRDDLIASFWNIFQVFKDVFFPIKEALSDVFGKTADDLLDVTKRLKAFTESIQISDKVEGIKNFATKVFIFLSKVFDIGKKLAGIVYDLVKPVGSLFGKIVGPSENLLDTLTSIAEKIADFLQKIRDSIKQNEAFSTVVSSIGDALTWVLEKIRDIGEFLSNNSVLTFISNVLKSIVGFLKQIATWATEAFSNFASGLKDAFYTGNADSFVSLLNGGLLAGGLVSLKKFIDNLSKMLKDTDISGSLKSLFDSIKKGIDGFIEGNRIKELRSIATSVLILSGAMLLLATIDPVKLATSLTAVVVLVQGLSNAIEQLNEMKIDSSNIKKITQAMVPLAAAILIMSFAVKKIGSLDFDSAVKGIFGVVVLLTSLSFMSDMDNTNENIVKIGKSFIFIGVAVLILTKAVEKLSSLETERLVVGLAGVATLLVALTAVSVFANPQEGMMKFGASMILLAVALRLLVPALEVFSKLSLDEMARGVETIALLMGIMAIVPGLMAATNGSAEGLVGFGVSMVLFAKAVEMLVKPLQEFGNMKLGNIAIGIGALATMVSVIAYAAWVIPKDFIATAAGMLLFVGTMAAMFALLDTLGKVDAAPLIAGIIYLVSVLGVLAAASNLILPSTLLGIAGAMAALGGSLMLVGLGAALVGAGLLLVGAGITSIGASLIANVAAIVGSIELFLHSLVTIIPSLATALAKALLVFLQTVADGAGSLIKSIVTLLKIVLVAVKEVVPLVVEVIFDIVKEALTLLVEKVPEIITLVFDFLVAVFEALADNTPRLVEIIGKFMSVLFSSIAQSFRSMNLTDFVDALKGIGIVATMIGIMAGISLIIPAAMAGVVGMGIFLGELAGVLAILGLFSQDKVFVWLVNEGSKFMASLGDALGAFVGSIIGGAFGAISESLPGIADQLSDFMIRLTPFIVGAKTINRETMDGVKAVAETILLLTAADILNGLTNWLTGGSSFSNFGEQLVPFGESLQKFSDSVANIDVEKVTAAANVGSIIGQMAKDLPKEGGVWGFLAGDSSMGTLSSQLGDFGQALVDFSNTASGISTEGMDKASQAFSTGDAMRSWASALEQVLKNGITGLIKELGSVGAEFASGFNKMVDDIAEQVDTIENVLKFKEIGNHILNGFLLGLEGSGQVPRAGEALVKKAEYGLKTYAEIKSPSRLFARIGEYIPMGFANGIESGFGIVESSGEGLAKTAFNSTSKVLSKVSDLINSDDGQLTIRPVLDLSNVEAGAGQIGALLSRNNALAIQSEGSFGSTFSTDGEPAIGATYSFTQNNYSPKALSRIEIYRQTRNQIAAMKGALV